MAEWTIGPDIQPDQFAAFVTSYMVPNFQMEDGDGNEIDLAAATVTSNYGPRAPRNEISLSHAGEPICRVYAEQSVLASGSGHVVVIQQDGTTHEETL
jgi:hypothetical protein